MNDRAANTEAEVTLSSYVIGLILSVILAVATYVIALESRLDEGTMISFLMGLGIIQALVQLHFFLHLGKGASARWNVVVFFFMIVVIAIIIGGTLWIMFNLNERVMPTSQEMDAYMLHESGMPVQH